MINPMKYSIFVGDLAVGTNEADLEMIFNRAGLVLDVRIVRDRISSKSLLYGFIDFETTQGAENAITSLNGFLFKGRAMRVKWANSKNGGKDFSEKNSSEEVINASVYVTFQPLIPGKTVSEIRLRNIFEFFGTVIDATIRQNVPKNQVYGFVRFSNDELGVAAAVKAVQEIRNVVIDGVNFFCDLGNDLKRRLGRPKIYEQPNPPVPFSPMHCSPSSVYSRRSQPRTENYYHPRYSNDSGYEMDYEHHSAMPIKRPTEAQHGNGYDNSGSNLYLNANPNAKRNPYNSGPSAYPYGSANAYASSSTYASGSSYASGPSTNSYASANSYVSGYPYSSAPNADQYDSTDSYARGNSYASDPNVIPCTNTRSYRSTNTYGDDRLPQAPTLGNGHMPVEKIYVEQKEENFSIFRKIDGSPFMNSPTM